MIGSKEEFNEVARQGMVSFSLEQFERTHPTLLKVILEYGHMVADEHAQREVEKQKLVWHRKLLDKLHRIRSGQLELKEYVEKIATKIRDGVARVEGNG